MQNPGMKETVDAVKQVHLLMLDVKTFGGNVESFQPFIRIFEMNIALGLDCQREAVVSHEVRRWKGSRYSEHMHPSATRTGLC